MKRSVFLCLYLLLSAFSSSVAAEPKRFFESKTLKKGILKTESGLQFPVLLAITPEDQVRGLSGIQPKQWPDNWGMFFYYQDDSAKSFWMPDTYFDLDIFFLDANLKVGAVERSVPFHPGYREPPNIARTKVYFVRHVLELKSGSKIAKSIIEGSTLKWVTKPKLK